ncbi:hypothetical protein DMI65_22895 [Escherichia coli]|nr:hypothetical protein [Escherichia coli]
MNASSWSRNLPGSGPRWRNGVMRYAIPLPCLALTVAYYLNLDEPYWAMTSAAVVSFPPLAVSSAKPRTHRWQFARSHCGTASCRTYAQ